MAEIKRYDVSANVSMDEKPDGTYVLYEEHAEAVVKLNVEMVEQIKEKEHWRTLAMQAQRGR